MSEAKIVVPFVASSPDPEVPEKAQRRKFSAEDKKRLLEEVDRAAGHGGIGAVLRREGIYSSTLYSWRKERDAAIHKAFSQKRGPQPKRNPLAGENEKLRRQNQRLQEELEKAPIVIDVQKKWPSCWSVRFRRSPARRSDHGRARSLRPLVGMKQACQVLSVPRATWYRRRRRRLFPTAVPSSEKGKRHSARALSSPEQSTVLACLHEERFQDCSPAQVYAALLDEGRFHCSIRTMYRLLETHEESRERRDQITHPPYQKPELLATQANQLWSWDITKLRGPVKWTVYHRYVILDVFSRYVVGWMIAHRESAELAKRLIEHSCRAQNIVPGQLTVHADRGSSMKSKPVALLLADLGVVKTHSRPHVSDDNPYSESQFRTLKYRPGFPDRFGSIEDARGFWQSFFQWYNHQHHHSGLGLMTPAMVHHGHASHILAHRQVVLDAAYSAHPERFVRKPPKPPELPVQVWINRPPAEENTP